MTSNVVSPRRKTDGDGRQLSPEQAAAAAMVAEAKARGLALTGPHGLLKLFTKNVLETALNEEMTEHLGHEKNQAESDRESTNVRNGSRGKTVISDAAGEVRIDVPRDREGTFEPQIVKKRQRRRPGVDEVVLSLYAKGLTTGEITARFLAWVYLYTETTDDEDGPATFGRSTPSTSTAGPTCSPACSATQGTA